ncbi:MAG: DUF2124 family protein [Archaeoglobaceae archaeon]
MLSKGIVGLTSAFREALSDLSAGEKVVFVGSSYVCTPFAELLAYAVRDKNFELIYVPKALEFEARRILELKNVCFYVSNEKADPKNPAAIVLLGGLAMPKFGCSTKDVMNFIEKIATKNTRILGVCFMGIFKKSGWDKMIPFNLIIDSTMEVFVEKFENCR